MATLVTRSGKGSPLTHAEVDANFTNLNTDKLELSGGTMTGNLSFGDNDKAIFGAGSDLQIYHDGTSGNTFISESGTGNLKITGENVRLEDASGNRYMQGVAGAQTNLYYAGGNKLSTTSTGIDVNGTVTADGLTFGAEGDTITFQTSSTPDGRITTGDNIKSNSLQVEADNAVVINSGQDDGGVSEVDGTFISRGSTFTKTALFNVNGDISFYEDTGTTAKFFWDASAESLGIGSTTTGGKLRIAQSSDASTGGLHIAATDGNAATIGRLTSGELTIRNNSIDTMSFKSGNVGIGTSSPAYELEVEDSSSNAYISIISSNTSDAGLLFGDTDAAARGGILYDNANNSLAFRTNTNTERMRIDSSGNVGIGRTSSAYGAQLSVQGGIETHSNQLNIAAGTSGVTPFEFVNRIGGGFDFYVNNATNLAARIDSSGNVGIGTSSPLTGLYSTVGHISGTSGGLILSSSTSTFGIGSVAGVLQVYDSTNSSERMRIDSSGNLLVGSTTYDKDVAGVYAGNNGVFYATTSGNFAASLNRKTSDGDILRLQKDGSTVGSIASRVGLVSTLILDPRTPSSNTGAGLGTTSAKIVPADTSGLTDAKSDLGDSGNRFRNLYLSGGVYLGGTGSANKLDDYEEGTWTPEYVFYDISDAAYKNFAGITYDIQEGTYVKVGRLVTLFFSLRTDSLDKTGTASSDLVSIDNLPFNVVEGGTGTIGAAVNWASAAPTQSFASAGETIALRTTLSGASGYNAIDVGDMATGANSNRILDCVIQYQTNA